jgi:cytochrome c biogenesis protein
VLTKDIRVNDFLSYNDVEFYQQDYGWAPEMVVRNPAGQVVYDGTIDFFGAQKNVQTGILKVPDFNYTIPGAQQPLQLGGRMAIFPDARTITRLNGDGSVATGQTNFGPGGEEARNPVVQLQLWVGDLGLDKGRAQNVNELDTSKMSPYLVDSTQNAVPFPIQLHETKQLVLPGADSAHPAAFTITFAGLKQYSLFMVKKDNGVPLVYATFLLIMTGLMVKLYLKPALDRHFRKRKAGRRSAVQLSPIATGTPSALAAEPAEAAEDAEEREPAGV